MTTGSARLSNQDLKPPLLGRLRHRALAISPAETRFDVRGFHDGAPAVRKTLEGHGASFVSGFNAALSAADMDQLEEQLELTPSAERGFAYEGAAMACTLLDLLSLGIGNRLARLLGSHGQPHVYMVHVGAGWALARLRLRTRGRLPALDPFLRWLALDGYGFHHGFFQARRFFDDRALERRVAGYERRAFDQGLGRSLWFARCADVERAAHTIGAFPAHRHGDLWSGLALAAGYTTTVGAAELERLLELAGDFRPQVGQGAAFAVTARHRAGNVVARTRMAAQVLCGHGVEEVAELTLRSRDGLDADPEGHGYERWRARLREGLRP